MSGKIKKKFIWIQWDENFLFCWLLGIFDVCTQKNAQDATFNAIMMTMGNILKPQMYHLT